MNKEKHYLYWIHFDDQKDILKEGYVGVTYRPVERFRDHKRENFNIIEALNNKQCNLLFDIVMIGEKDYCYFIENKLRPTDHIGWNIAPGGGGVPPDNRWRKPLSLEHGIKIGIANKNRIIKDETRLKLSLLKSGTNHHMYGKKHSTQTIEQMRKVKLGRTASDTEREKNSISQRLLVESGNHNSKSINKCPHCYHTGVGPAMFRWHFDNCKKKDAE